MKNDERVNAEINIAKSIGYTIFWFGIFAVLLYRWFILNQSLMDTLDFFLVWLLASLAQFITLAVKGIPMTYPVPMSYKEQRYFVFFIPLLTGILSASLVLLRIGLDFRRMLGGFLVSFFGTLVLFLLYKTILFLWEKRNT